MKKMGLFIVLMLATVVLATCMLACDESAATEKHAATASSTPASLPVISVDTTQMPHGPYGDAVRYGRELMLNTAYYIGPKGVNGTYLGNAMNCSNCHQDAGTKPYSFNLMSSHDNYPQYRAREGKVLTLAERVNNCVMRPHNGKPLPLDGPEMLAFLSYLKWINGFVPKNSAFQGAKSLEVSFPAVAASSQRGAVLFSENCARCHGANGEGQWKPDHGTYLYPPLWGDHAYQAGSSMHRVIKQAQWIKHNMPYDKTTDGTPFLTDEQALDIAAFVNDDDIHKRPDPKNYDYPHPEEKAIDYDRAPFADSFPATAHKYGPYQPIIDYLKAKNIKPVY